MAQQGEAIAVDVRYFHLGGDLAPYFTALYLFSTSCPADHLVEDRLHPEWAAMRFTASGRPPLAAISPGSLEQTPPFVVSGPNSRAIGFGLHRSRIWGLGLRPAGFARFVDCSASGIADTILDGARHAGFASFAPLLQLVGEQGVDDRVMAGRIEQFLLAKSGAKVPQERYIRAAEDALRDQDIATVDDFCERVGLSRRSLERMCARYFGFAPKMLIRRQRFLRSLAQFTLAGGASWSRALDQQYYDQAHFVRDFKAFMGMTPTEYAATPHPVLDRILVQRMADQGALPPTDAARTDLPTMLRYGKIA